MLFSYVACLVAVSLGPSPLSETGDRDAYVEAIAHRQKMPVARGWMLDPAQDQRVAAPITWANIGPRGHDPIHFSTAYWGPGPNSGRKSAVVLAPSDPSRIYVASAGGGVWKSVNSGTSFSPLSDNWPSLYTTSIAVHPTNPDVVYAGTGDYYGTMKTGFGIMKSEDGGSTWANLGVNRFGTSTLKKIWINPANPANLVVFAVGGSDPGIYRSVDSGASWSLRTTPASDWLDLDIASNGKLYACSPTAGVYQSVDNGQTWTAVPTPKPTGSGGTVWDIAASKRNATTLYLITNASKIFKSSDSGASWTTLQELNPNAYFNAFGSLSIETRASADNVHDVISIGIGTLYMSQDSGAFFKDVSDSLETFFDTTAKCHIGIFDTEFIPGPEIKLLLAGHGGLYQTSVNPDYSSSWQYYNSTFIDDEMQNVTVHPTDSTYVMGGVGISGTAASRGAPTTSPWKGLGYLRVSGVAFDRTNPARHYVSLDQAVLRYGSATATFWNIIFQPQTVVNPLPLTMVGEGGSTPTTAENGDLKIYNGTPHSWTSVPTGGGTIRTISSSPHSELTIFTGAVNGDIFQTTDLAQNFRKVDGNLPDYPISGISESPLTANSILVGLLRDDGPGVYHCIDINAPNPAWINRSGSGATALPLSRVNDVAHDPLTNSYYAATDVGVFVSPDLGANWYNMNALGMPNLRVNDLWVYSNNGASFLYAGTDGRGIWRCFLSNRFITAVQIAKPEIYGGQQNTITVKLNGSAPIGTVVQLSDTSLNVSIPTSIAMPQGSTQATFTAFSTNPTTTQTVTITAKTWESTVTNSFTLHAVPNFTYTPESTDLYGGNKFTAMIDLGIPAPITTVVTFSDTLTEIGSPTATSLGQGQSSKAVTLHTLTVTSTTPGTISAKIANTTVTSPVTLHPRPDLAALSVSPTSVQGGTNATGRITMSSATGGAGQVVRLTDSSTIVTTPPTVLAGPGLETEFNIETNSTFIWTFNVTIKATLRGVTRTTVLTVHP